MPLLAASLHKSGNGMASMFIAWAVLDFQGAASQSVLVRDNGATEPPDYRIPRNVCNVRVRMIGVDPHLAVEVVADRFVVRHLPQVSSKANVSGPQFSKQAVEPASS